jgi:hypothetical protein
MRHIAIGFSFLVLGCGKPDLNAEIVQLPDSLEVSCGRDSGAVLADTLLPLVATALGLIQRGDSSALRGILVDDRSFISLDTYDRLRGSLTTSPRHRCVMVADSAAELEFFLVDRRPGKRFQVIQFSFRRRRGDWKLLGALNLRDY